METYSQEFTDQIAELHRKGGRTFMDLAKEFNLSATTVSNWVRAAEKREAKAARAAAAGDLFGGHILSSIPAKPHDCLEALAS